MTMPRQVLPGTTWMLSRRCLRRMFRLKPSKWVRALVPFLLAWLAFKYDIQLHAFCFMSNHFHLVLTDPHGKLPDFMRDLAAFIARALNQQQDSSETFWAPGSYSAVALATAEDVADKIAYVLANPATANLVSYGREWAGPHSLLEQVGAMPESFPRPSFFFRKNGKAPTSARLALVLPPGFESVAQFRAVVARKLRAREVTAAEKRRKLGLSCLGNDAAEAQSVFGRPSSVAPLGGLRPHVAARDKRQRIEALRRLMAFRDAYREARARWLEGIRSVEFPAGTYWMRVAHGCRCAVAA